MLLEILKSGDLFENEGEILSEDELNRAIARNDTEYRMF